MDPDTLIHLRKFLITEIACGARALGLAGRHAHNFGASKVLIVTDAGMIDSGWTAKVEKSLRQSVIPCAVFGDVSARILNRGCKGFIQKPFTVNVLANKNKGSARREPGLMTHR